MCKQFLLWSLLLIALKGWCQEPVIRLANPSFEGEKPAIRAPDRSLDDSYVSYSPPATKVPDGWFNAGFEGETPPDIQPGTFGCVQKPIDGESYLGMVTRDNGTWERVGQKLPAPMLKDSLYDFSVCLSVSPEYKSNSRASGRLVNYNSPTILRIWGVNAKAQSAELLAESPSITNNQWVRYIFRLLPVRIDAEIILLEVYFFSEEKATNGHILLDNCSNLLLATNSPAADSLRQFRTNARAFLPKEAGLFNSSFEWGPNNVLPTGWVHTTDGFETLVRTHPAVSEDVFYLESAGAIHYASTNFKPVRLKAQAGNRYLSLLSSETGKTQQVSQELDVPLKKDSNYIFSVYLARSKHFYEYRLTDKKRTDFKNPLKLRVWGGTLRQPKMELLAESGSVIGSEWKKFGLQLKPGRQDYFCLTLEAWYVSDVGKPYNGNLLLDNCSLTATTNQ